MSPEIVLAVVGSAGFTALLTAVVNALTNRRKLSADATKIITEAASGVVERLEGEIARKDTEHKNKVDDLESRIAALEGERDASRDALQLHAAWDEVALYKLRETGLADDLPQPPPLYPPPASRVAPR